MQRRKQRSAEEEEEEEEEEWSSSEGGSEEEEEEEEEENDESDEEEDEEALREQLATIPFDQLQKLRKQSEVKRALQGEKHRSDSTTKSLIATSSVKKKSKSKPQEVSSKTPPKRFAAPRSKLLGVKPEPKRRDPRFDSLCGKFNEELYKASYSFVNDYRQDEIKTLRQQLRKEKNPSERENIQRALTRLQQEAKTEQQEESRRQRKKTLKQQEREMVKQGKKPFYLKKSELKKQELQEQFKDLKAKGQLDKYLQKKRKRKAQREHKHIPWKRRALSTEQE